MFKITDPTILKVFNSLSLYGNTAVFGGYIRDTLLGINPKDIDITTNAPLERVVSLFPYANTRTSLSGHTIVSFTLNKKSFEIVPTDEQLTQKALLADLNINSLMYNGEEIIDPTNSQSDFQRKVITGLGNNFYNSVQVSPFIWFKPITLCASTGFSIDTELLNVLLDNKNLIYSINPSIKAQDAYRILDRPYTLNALLYLSEIELIRKFSVKFDPKPLMTSAFQKNYHLQLVLLSYATSFDTINDFVELFHLPSMLKSNFRTLISLLNNEAQTTNYTFLNQKLLIERTLKI